MALIGENSGSTQEGFRLALRRFSSESQYVAEALSNPSIVLRDFPGLTMHELDSLRDAAVLSGTDVSSIDPLIDGVVNRAAGGPTLGGDGCCCCCCCGATGEVRRG